MRILQNILFGVASLLLVISGALIFTSLAFPTYYKFQATTLSSYVPDEHAAAMSLLENLGETEVTVIFTKDPEINCGAAGAESGKGGCFRHVTPDTIYISPGVDSEVLKYLVYHEYAHLQHLRNGEEGGECEADAQAQEWGASLAYSGYDDCGLTETKIVRDYSRKDSFKKHKLDQLAIEEQTKLW